MTPQDVVRTIGNKKVCVNKLEVTRPGNHFCMALVRRTKAKDGVVNFNSMMHWETCRETMSGYVRRRLKKTSTCGYEEYTGGLSDWGYPQTRTVKIKIQEVFGDGNPMCIAINHMSYESALKAKKFLNSLERLNKVPKIGRTEVLDCRFVADAVNINHTRKGKLNRKGVIFVIPECWTKTIPHLSLYLLIIRTVYKYKPRNTESFTDFWKRIGKDVTADKRYVQRILTYYPELPQTMVKHWKTIAGKLPVYKKGYWHASSTNGISALIGQAHYYATCPGRKFGETMTDFRKRYIRDQHVTAAHKEIVKYIAGHIVRYNNRQHKAKKSKKAK